MCESVKEPEQKEKGGWWQRWWWGWRE